MRTGLGACLLSMLVSELSSRLEEEPALLVSMFRDIVHSPSSGAGAPATQRSHVGARQSRSGSFVAILIQVPALLFHLIPMTPDKAECTSFLT